jgi:lysozyme family protein
MIPSIDSILEATLKTEGGYSNNPNDAGGETNWGVTIAVAQANGFTGAMRDMTKAQALEVYRSQYFVKPGWGLVMGVSPGIATECYDTGVNMGPKVASVFLQRTLNVLNRQGKDYGDLVVDGAVGPATVNALRALIAKRGSTAETVVLKALNCLQGARYIELAEGRQANEDFAYGWLSNRVELPQ